MRRWICLLCAVMLALPLSVWAEGGFIVVEDEEDLLPPDTRRQARALMRGMTDEEKAYQLLFVTVEDLTGEEYSLRLPEENLLKGRKVGGVAVYGQNIESEAQLSALTESLQAQARAAGAYPLFIGVHEAGGAASRVAGKLGYARAAGPDETHSAPEARVAGETIAAYLAPLGINVDLLVPLDTRIAEEADIALRSYAAEDVYPLAAALAEGLRAGGILPCFGHFPGDGSVNRRKYDGSRYISRTLNDMRAREWRPFARAIADGAADMMMMSNAVLRAAGDDMPASLSRRAVDGLLRGELGFDGVVLTESLRALGVTNFYAPGEAAVLAVQAGADMLFLSADPDAAAQGILRALQTGEISRERLDESVERILALKIASGLIR